MTMQIHIVIASQGEYSDRTEWPVCAYLDEAVAREHVRLSDETDREADAAWQLAMDKYIEMDDKDEADYPGYHERTIFCVSTIPLYDAVVPVIDRIVVGAA